MNNYISLEFQQSQLITNSCLIYFTVNKIEYGSAIQGSIAIREVGTCKSEEYFRIREERSKMKKSGKFYDLKKKKHA